MVDPQKTNDRSAARAAPIAGNIKAATVVRTLLEADHWVGSVLGEASVHRPRRGQTWIASFSGPLGQQWKSTHTRDYEAALAIARQLEAAAKAQSRHARRACERASGGLTQKEVAAWLKLSERAVRAIEKRALRKLAQNAELRALWQTLKRGPSEAQEHRLSAAEILAVLRLARTPAELAVLSQVLDIVQGC